MSYHPHSAYTSPTSIFFLHLALIFICSRPIHAAPLTENPIHHLRFNHATRQVTTPHSSSPLNIVENPGLVSANVSLRSSSENGTTSASLALLSNRTESPHTVQITLSASFNITATIRLPPPTTDSVSPAHAPCTLGAALRISAVHGPAVPSFATGSAHAARLAVHPPPTPSLQQTSRITANLQHIRAHVTGPADAAELSVAVRVAARPAAVVGTAAAAARDGGSARASTAERNARRSEMEGYAAATAVARAGRGAGAHASGSALAGVERAVERGMKSIAHTRRKGPSAAAVVGTTGDAFVGYSEAGGATDGVTQKEATG